MKVLYAASEARPFVASGGLADVAGSLPQSLVRKGVDCRVVLPLYSSISQELRRDFKFVVKFELPVAWRSRSCVVCESHYDGVTYYFIENDGYFARDTLYEEYDNAERFAFFCRAVLEMLPHIGFLPDVINANDWQTALIPIYQHLYYSKISWYSNIKTVITIHNIAFQGVYGFEIFNDTLGLPDWAVDLVEYNKDVNILKGSMQAADSIATVSPSYAKEISGHHTDTSGYDFGQGLTPFLNKEAWKLTGILNGVDMNAIDPSKDKQLYARYRVTTFQRGKKLNKLKLQERLGLEQNADIPLMGIVTRIDSKQKGCQLVLDVLNEGLLDEHNVQFVLLGSAAKGDKEGKKLEYGFREIENRYRGRAVAYIGFVPELAQKIYAASDIYLMPSKYEPCGLSQIIALKYGSIPIVRETGGLADTIEDSYYGTGYGFTFKNYNSIEFRGAIERALMGYKDRNGWNILTKRAMERDFSWDGGPVSEYIELYKSLIGHPLTESVPTAPENTPTVPESPKNTPTAPERTSTAPPSLKKAQAKPENTPAKPKAAPTAPKRTPAKPHKKGS